MLIVAIETWPYSNNTSVVLFLVNPAHENQGDHVLIFAQPYFLVKYRT